MLRTRSGCHSCPLHCFGQSHMILLRQYALAARGWVVGSWEEVAQMDKDKETRKSPPPETNLSMTSKTDLIVIDSTVDEYCNAPDSEVWKGIRRSGKTDGWSFGVFHAGFRLQDMPLEGSKDAAFRHYCSSASCVLGLPGCNESK